MFLAELDAHLFVFFAICFDKIGDTALILGWKSCFQGFFQKLVQNVTTLYITYNF